MRERIRALNGLEMLKSTTQEVFGYTSVSLASSLGQVKVVSMILAARPAPGRVACEDARADLESACNLGNTALHLAARAGHSAVVRALVVHKAHLDRPSRCSEGVHVRSPRMRRGGHRLSGRRFGVWIV